MNHNIRSLCDIKRETDLGCVPRCSVSDDAGAMCGETRTLDIVKLLTQLYLDRLRNVKGDNKAVQETLLLWVEDLTEQNSLLVEAVEELEQDFVCTVNSMATGVRNEVRKKSHFRQTDPETGTHINTYTGSASAQTDCPRTAVRDKFTQTLLPPAPSTPMTPPWIAHLKSLPRTCSGAATSTSSIPLVRPIPSPLTLTLSRSAQTCDKASSYLSRPTQTPHVHYADEYTQTVEIPVSRLSSSAVASGELGSSFPMFPMAGAGRSRCGRDAQTQTQTQTAPERAQLTEAMKRVETLNVMLRDSYKANTDTRQALTTEVAQKHDQIMALRKQVQQLEDRLLHADKQTHFKDDIIREMRKQLKISSSKVNSGSPDIVSVQPKKIAFARECECASTDNSTGHESTKIKICNRAELVNSLQNELRCMERELNQCRRAVVSGASLSDLEEFRVRTVEAQAAVEDLRDELAGLVSESRVCESQMEIVRIALDKCSVALNRARSKLASWRPPEKDHTSHGGGSGGSGGGGSGGGSGGGNGCGDTENLCALVDSARDALQQATNCADGFLRGRDTRQELRARRERRVDRLQEELDEAHDAMRDGVETLSKAVDAKSRQIQDKSSKERCDGLDCVHLVQINKLRGELSRLRLDSPDGTAGSNESQEGSEWLRTELDIMTRNLHTKEKMLADKEETVRLLEDSLERAKEEIRALKEQPLKKELTLDLMEMHHQFQLCYDEAARQEQWLTSLRSAVDELRGRAERERLRTAAAQQEADRLRQIAVLQTARGNLLEERLRMVEETVACLQLEGCAR